MRSLNPICVKCHRFYRAKKNGFYFVEGMPIGNRAEPGIENDAKWENYKLWSGDLWECQGCGHLLIEGVGNQPIAEHYQPDFVKWVASCKAYFRVNDC